MISMNASLIGLKDGPRNQIAADIELSNIKPTQAPADYRAADFHRALVLPGSIDHSAEKRRGRK